MLFFRVCTDCSQFFWCAPKTLTYSVFCGQRNIEILCAKYGSNYALQTQVEEFAFIVYFLFSFIHSLHSLIFVPNTSLKHKNKNENLKMSIKKERVRDTATRTQIFSSRLSLLIDKSMRRVKW